MTIPPSLNHRRVGSGLWRRLMRRISPRERAKWNRLHVDLMADRAMRTTATVLTDETTTIPTTTGDPR